MNPALIRAQVLPIRQVHVHAGSTESRTIELPQSMSPEQAATEALINVQRRGYLHARIDSTSIVRAGVMNAYLTLGEIVRLEGYEISDESLFVDLRLDHVMELSPGDPLDLDRLENTVAELLQELARRGHVLASIRISSIALSGEGETRATVSLEINRGGPAILRGIELSGAERTRPAHAMRLLRLQRGQHLAQFDADEVQRRLIESGLFGDVGTPRIRSAADSVTLVLPVIEEQPGSFDLAFGYQPSDAGASLVGSGHLELLNPFGSGRRFMLNLDRLPGQTSRFEAEAADPFLLGTPIRIAASFSGYQQDSLFHRQHVGMEIGYELRGGLEVFATGSLDRSRPGTAGSRIEGGRQRIARSDATMFGGGVRFSRLDYARNPSRGLVIEAVAERGLNRRSQSRLVDADTTREHRAVRQDRAGLMTRSYVPLGSRSVFVSGIDVHALLSDEYDRSDFIRIGGLRTLRGYDDDRFLVRVAGRGLIEYRHRLDRLSYLLAFVDVAYLERPQLHDIEGFMGWRTGFGIGAQFDTGFSLMNVVLAANPSDGISTPRIHAGISFGL